MMQVYKAVSFTKFYENSSCDYGWLYISVEGDETSCKIEYKEAVKLAYQLSRKLGKPLEMENNRFNPMITSVEIGGFLS